LESKRCESEGHPTPPDTLVYSPDGVPSCAAVAVGPGGPCLILLVNNGLDAINVAKRSAKDRERGTAVIYGSAENALDCVCVLIAENVFVITATNKLMSQKLSTTTQMMKKKLEKKNSESITEYINDDHYNTHGEEC